MPLCVCMYVSVGTHVPRHTCGSQILDGSSFSNVCDISSTALVIVYTKLAGLWASGVLHLCLSFLILDTCYCAQFLYRFWGFELRYSHLCGKYLSMETFLQTLFVWFFLFCEQITYFLEIYSELQLLVYKVRICSVLTEFSKYFPKVPIPVCNSLAVYERPINNLTLGNYPGVRIRMYNSSLNSVWTFSVNGPNEDYNYHLCKQIARLMTVLMGQVCLICLLSMNIKELMEFIAQIELTVTLCWMLKHKCSITDHTAYSPRWNNKQNFHS